ncbi:MAG: DNA recombination protein RmuC [Crocinitomicaceae bacterium]
MDYIALMIGLAAGGALGFLLASLRKKEAPAEVDNSLDIEVGTLRNTNAILEKELSSTKESMSEIQSQNSILLQSEATLKSQFAGLQEKLEVQKSELNELQERFRKDFELVANKILEEKTEKFTEQNKKNLDTILNPLKERIGEFQKKVEDSNEKNTERSAALDKHLQMLQELNREITQETKSLTQALRGDSKTQGNWGEFQLESILEKAGLERDIHYSKETNLKTESGENQRLDYIINLPDGKHLILDSKVSLTAYSKYFDTDDVAEQELYLKQHLDSISGHVKLLGSKDYQKLHGINSPDYVMMFVANEPALTLALKEDMNLFEKALDKNIVIVSTSTLLATLRTISYIWKQENQSKNAMEIADQAAKLYDKFVGFTEDLIKLGGQMRTATKTYEESMKKLTDGSGNLVRRVENLKKLGVNPSKQVDTKLVDRSEED